MRVVSVVENKKSILPSVCEYLENVIRRVRRNAYRFRNFEKVGFGCKWAAHIDPEDGPETGAVSVAHPGRGFLLTFLLRCQ